MRTGTRGGGARTATQRRAKAEQNDKQQQKAGKPRTKPKAKPFKGSGKRLGGGGEEEYAVRSGPQGALPVERKVGLIVAALPGCCMVREQP